MASIRSDSGENEPLLSDCPDVGGPRLDSAEEGVLPEPGLMRVTSVIICFGSVGLYTASIGALIPLLETYYNIKDTGVAWILVVNVVGYLLGAASLEMIHLFAGRRGVALMTSGLHLLGVTLLATKPLYPIALTAYLLFGIGTGCSDAGFCAWAAKVRNANVVQGFIHGSFSIGCIFGPTIVAALEEAELGWNMFYLVMLGAFGVEFCALLFAFRHDTSRTYCETLSGESETVITLANSWKPIIYCASFYLCYVGIETSLSAWLVTFMSRSRKSSSFVAALTSSMFWVGMAVGRFTMAPMAKASGLRHILIIYILLSLVLQVLFRFQLHVAVSLSLAASIGFSFGPMYPAGILMLSSQVPQRLQVRGCSIAASVGQLGGAGAPFLLGLIAESWGIQRLLDLVLFMSVLLLAIWIGFSNPIKK